VEQEAVSEDDALVLIKALFKEVMSLRERLAALESASLANGAIASDTLAQYRNREKASNKDNRASLELFGTEGGPSPHQVASFL
jgi:hypothetical protein